jgi:farnesyl diphosphate synthase
VYRRSSSISQLESFFVGCHNSATPELLEVMKYACLNTGKLLRPQLSAAAAEISNANKTDSIFIGSVIEIIHCFSLIHDDLPSMDNSVLRRGMLSTHAKYGETLALLAGDALHAMAFELLSSSRLNMDTTLKLKLIHMLAQASGISGMVAGQTAEFLLHKSAHTISIEDIENIHNLKTGKLISVALLSGYLLGDNTVEYQNITLIAHKLGLMFQIIDDIHDLSTDMLAANCVNYAAIAGIPTAKNAALSLYHDINSTLTNIPNSQQLSFLANSIYNTLQ